MSERAIFFGDLSEILKREKFSLDHGIAVENFQGLIGPYNLPEDAYCQVEHQGARCNQRHRKGFVGRRHDGAEALIGGDCATKYFRASTDFQLERKRVDSEVKIDGHVAALTALLKDRTTLSDRVAAALQRIKAVRDVAREYQGVLSQDAQKRLSDMVKTGNRSVYVEVRYVEQTDDGKEKVSWQQREIGTLQGVSFWDGTIATELYLQLDAIKDSISSAKASRQEREKDLRAWRDNLESLPRCEERIAAMERALADFTTSTNATLLSALGRRQANRLDLAKLTLKMGGQPTPMRQIVDAFIANMKASLSERVDGREYRGV